jgi:hypothetical protein
MSRSSEYRICGRRKECRVGYACPHGKAHKKETDCDVQCTGGGKLDPPSEKCVTLTIEEAVAYRLEGS